MLQNLSLKGFTWPREPVLYLTLLVAVVNVVVSFLEGDVSWAEGLETVAVLVAGFIARGQVTPV